MVTEMFFDSLVSINLLAVGGSQAPVAVPRRYLDVFADHFRRAPVRAAQVRLDTNHGGLGGSRKTHCRRD